LVKRSLNNLQRSITLHNNHMKQVRHAFDELVVGP
jgi:hypothetical protein